ncbi:uncharacterized protein G2W53_021823 [Senna tora]|uniref:Uncharacterized protein n=1 Tax=Senna tora TaxID=362788 RepID=A0A834TTH1_9FABA|nr:uncharacterized protein G2W53_021823 [Senna tora]
MSHPRQTWLENRFSANAFARISTSRRGKNHPPRDGCTIWIYSLAIHNFFKKREKRFFKSLPSLTPTLKNGHQCAWESHQQSLPVQPPRLGYIVARAAVSTIKEYAAEPQFGNPKAPYGRMNAKPPYHQGPTYS